MLHKEAQSALGPIFALLRSTTNEKATQLVQRRLEQSFYEPLTAYLQGDEARVRAGMVAAILLGFATAHAIISTSPLTEADPALIIEILGHTLQDYFD